MKAILENIEFPELFLGMVSPMGVDIDEVSEELESNLKKNGYHVIKIRITDLFEIISTRVKPKNELKKKPLQERYESYIQYGNQLRSHFKDQAFLAAVTVSEISRLREDYYKLNSTPESKKYAKTAYIIRQFKNKEEISFLRTIYGKTFTKFQYTHAEVQEFIAYQKRWRLVTIAPN